MSEFFPSSEDFFAGEGPMPSEAHKTAWSAVMRDLVIATHCHSCGGAGVICLRGYTGTHCSKRCWKINEFELLDDFVCLFGGCKICDGGFVSLAQSMWHRPLANSQSSSGACWPMMGMFAPCTNECIRTRRPIDIVFGFEPAVSA